MNKAGAMIELAEIEKRAANLRAIITAPERAPSLLISPKPGSHADYWAIRCGDMGEQYKLCTTIMSARDGAPAYYEHGNVFQSKELAKAYADAFDTMLLLRHQPGTVPALSQSFPVSIELTVDADVPLRTIKWTLEAPRLNRISPMFATEAAAQAAISVVGAEKIIRMFKTLQHIKD